MMKPLFVYQWDSSWTIYVYRTRDSRHWPQKKLRYVFQDLVAKSVFSWNAKFHTYDDMFTSGDETLRACALMQCREFIWTFQFESTASATYCGFSPEEWSQISFQWIEMEYYVVAAGNWFVMLLLATIWLMVVLPVACRLGLCSTAQGSGRYMQVRNGQTYHVHYSWSVQIGSLQVASSFGIDCFWAFLCQHPTF